MIKTYNVIRENQKIRMLISMIKSHYRSKSKNPIQEVNLEHVSNRIVDIDIKKLIKSNWKDLEMTLGHQLR